MRTLTSILVALAVASLTVSGFAEEAKKTKRAKGKKAVEQNEPTPNPNHKKLHEHSFFKAGWKTEQIRLVDKNGKSKWSSPAPQEPSDAWILKDGSVVHSFSQRHVGSGVIRLDANGKQVWKYTADEGRDNHSCQPLPNGGFLTGEASTEGAWMVEIDANGKKVKEVKMELEVVNVSHTFRHVRLTAEGTYLACHMKENVCYEWDADGKVIRTFANGGFSAIRLPNGNTLVSGKPRDDLGIGGVAEYDKDGKVVWTLTAKDFEELGLMVKMICGVQRLPNGNTIVTNVPHGSITTKGALYKAFEITRDKKLVWFIDDSQFDKENLGSLQITDIKGDPAKFEVLR